MNVEGEELKLHKARSMPVFYVYWIQESKSSVTAIIITINHETGNTAITLEFGWRCRTTITQKE